MAWPLKAPHNRVTTPWGKRGTSWGCDKDAQGRGVHTGADLAAPKGTPIFAPIAGQIRHRDYGAAFGPYQFAISPDADQPFGDGEVFIAHGLSRLPDGARVEIGQQISQVGDLGNATGPHVHLEYRPLTKNQWACRGHANPQPIFGYQSGEDVVPAHTENIYSEKLGYGEPTNGDESSETVKELQSLLSIPITGRYDDATDVAVRKWQWEVCGDTADPAGQSYLGEAQRERMFAMPPYTIHDTGLPEVASGGTPEQPESVDGTTLGDFLGEQGFIVHDMNVPIGRDSKWLGVEYIMVHHTASPVSTSAASDAHWIKTGTGYPPLAQLMLDRQNEVWVCCQEREGQPSPGRASHAGQGRGYGIPDGTMNERSLGIEVCNDGTQPLASDPDQYATLIKLINALRDRYNVPSSKVIGHKEWSSTGKVDPRDSMDKIRADVAAGAVTQPPVVEPPPGPVQPWDYLTQLQGDVRYAKRSHTHDPVGHAHPGYAATNHSHPTAGGSKTVIWPDFSGKPTKTQIIPADSTWRMIDGIACDDPPLTGTEDHMLYARLNFIWRPVTGAMPSTLEQMVKQAAAYTGKVECKYVREGGDETSFDERHYAYGTKSVPFQQLHWEEGEKGHGGRWWMKFHGGLASVEITTRYGKVRVIAVV